MTLLQTLKSNPLSLLLGTRGSALARAQTTLVSGLLQQAHPDLCIEQKIIVTSGDANPRLAIHEPTSEASGLFTRQLEEALLSHTIDAAVHSLKDLPVITPPGLMLAAILPRASTSDLLITLQPGGLAALPSEAVIGTSSPRRTEILRQEREDLLFIPLRGNVPTRLQKLTQIFHPDGNQRAGKPYENRPTSITSHQREYRLDGIVLARAGLERLGYDLQIDNGKGEFLLDQTTLHITELSVMLPAPGQGAIAIETRAEKDPSSAAAYMGALHDPKTAACVMAERLLLHSLGGGCHMALGARANIEERSERIHLQGIYFPFPGATPRRGEASGATPEEVALLVAIQLGEKLA